MSTASQPNAAYMKSGLPRGTPMPPSMQDNGMSLPVTGFDRVAHGHALTVIKKLQTCLDEETANLAQSRVTDLDSFNHRKGQGLMELNRALSSVGTIAPNSEVAIELTQLKSKIDENMRVLRLHISAVNEITGLLTDAIQKEDSDGTYSPAIRGQWRSA